MQRKWNLLNIQFNFFTEQKINNVTIIYIITDFLLMLEIYINITIKLIDLPKYFTSSFIIKCFFFYPQYIHEASGWHNIPLKGSANDSLYRIQDRLEIFYY